MNGYGPHIPPSETVEWQWPKPVKLSESAGWLGWYAIGAAAGWAYWTDALADDFWPGAMLAFAIPAGMNAAGKLLRLVGIPLWGRRWVAVTGQRIVLTTGRILPRRKTVYRDLVHSASLYEGDGTVVLHGRDGNELLRFAWWDDDRCAELLGLLDVPTAVWSNRKPSAPVRAIRRKALVISLGLWALLAGAGICLSGLGGIADAAGWLFRFLAGAITMPGAIVASVAGGAVGLFGLLILQMILFDAVSLKVAGKSAPPAVMQELICVSGDPLWGGSPREPGPPDKIPGAMDFVNDMAKFFGLPPAQLIPLEPDWRDFNSRPAAKT